MKVRRASDFREVDVPGLDHLLLALVLRRAPREPGALDHAAWYLARVVCEQADHQHAPDAWPCRRVLAWATEQVHLLASSFPSSFRKDQRHANESQAIKRPLRKRGRKRG